MNGVVMRKSLKKALIYLIMTMLVLPTWLVTGMMSATHVKAAHPDADGNTIFDQGDVIISEFMADPSKVTDANGEWIELHNMLNKSVNLAGWKIDSQIIGDVTITANAFLLICRNDDSSLNGGLDCDYEESGIELTNTSGNILLESHQGATISSVSYSSVASGESKSYNGSAWINETLHKYGSGDFGTPGYDFPEMTSVLPDDNSYLSGISELKFDGSSFGANNLDQLELDFYRGDALVEQANLIADNTQLQTDLVAFKESDSELADSVISALYVPEDEKWIVNVNTKSIFWSDGKYKIFVSLWDEDGNKWGNNAPGSVENKVFNYTVDNTTPSLTVNVDDLTSSVSSPEITGTVSDGGTNVSGVKLELTVNSIAYLASIDCDGNWTVQIDESLKNGEYPITAKATDLAGNQSETNEMLKVNKLVVSPELITKVDGKQIKITWTRNEGETYNYYFSSRANGVVSQDNYVKFVKNVAGNEIIETVGEYGDYYIAVVAIDGAGNESTLAEASKQLVHVSAPAPVATVTPVATVDPTPAPAPVAASIAPQKAQAAAPVEKKIETPADDSNGQIKGDDTDNDETEKINWTPWIVLFVLIVLAGAATGGYFYWFAGEEEVKAVVKTPAKEEKKEKVETIVKTKQPTKKSNKKAKRW